MDSAAPFYGDGWEFESLHGDMPYKDKEKQREYQKKWIAQRRRDYLLGKECFNCGSKEDLQLDHIDPSQKRYNPAQLWGMSELNENRIAELDKCQILCLPCHEEKTFGVGGDLHSIMTTTSDTMVCGRGHDMNKGGFKRNVQKSGFTSRQCLYCSYVNRKVREGQPYASFQEYCLQKP